VCQTVKNIHSNGLIKLLDLSNAFIVEYLLKAISSMPDISTSVLKQKQNIKLTCVAVTKYPGFVNYIVTMSKEIKQPHNLTQTRPNLKTRAM
jgi:hypothetical protein